MKKGLSTVLMKLAGGSGLKDGRPLLWWHPIVIAFAFIVAMSIILKGIKDTYKELKHFLINEKFRTKL